MDVRVLVSLFSLVLFLYLVGQLVSGLVMFEVMLGVPPLWALIVTSSVLLVYVVLGGAHADILTDGAQGVMMLALAVVVIVLFVLGVGVDGGVSGLLDSLERQDENLVGALNPSTPLYHSPWSIICIVFAHIPLGLLPHVGNKLWALKGASQQRSFVKLAFAFGITLGMLGLAGLLARGVLGGALLEAGANLEMARVEGSLRLVEVDELALAVFAPGEAFGNRKRRVQGRFRHAGRDYALWVTDPICERHYLAKLDGDYRLERCFLTISLGEPYDGYCYKLIAAVIEDV